MNYDEWFKEILELGREYHQDVGDACEWASDHAHGSSPDYAFFNTYPDLEMKRKVVKSLHDQIIEFTNDDLVDINHFPKLIEKIIINSKSTLFDTSFIALSFLSIIKSKYSKEESHVINEAYNLLFDKIFKD